MKTKFKVVDHENYKILITNELLTEIAYQDWEKKIISAQNNPRLPHDCIVWP